jgi:hypothetical protein
MFFQNHPKKNSKERTPEPHILLIQEIVASVLVIIETMNLILKEIKNKEDNSNLEVKENIIKEIGIRIEINNFNLERTKLRINLTPELNHESNKSTSQNNLLPFNNFKLPILPLSPLLPLPSNLPNSLHL